MKKIILFLFITNIFAHELTKSDQAEMVDGGLLDYMYLGAKHMVTGYDHILFLIGVIFFLTKLSDIIKFVTAFRENRKMMVKYKRLWPKTKVNESME